nr:MAG TPA: hypothetical protein [Caudoviricetes sp.]
MKNDDQNDFVRFLCASGMGKIVAADSEVIC